MASIISAGTTSGTSLNLSGDTSGVLQLASNGSTTAVTINTSQGVAVLNCLGVGNATPSTSGAGITFPASQSASTDANTLDDYEEGDYTPTITDGVTSISYSNQTGRYTKIGNLVYVSVRLIISAGTTNGNVLTISLPFTVASTSNLFVPGAVYANVCASGGQNLFIIARPATSQIECYVQTATTITNFSGTNYGTSGDISFAFSYRV
jgi:hypothetical protein